MAKRDTMRIIADAVKSQVLSAVHGGMTVPQAAEEFNVSESSVRRWMKGIGVPAAAQEAVAPARASGKPAQKPAQKPAKASEKEPEKEPAKASEKEPEKESNVLEINREVTYRSGKRLFRKRILKSSNRYKVAQMVKDAIPNVKDEKDMDKIKEQEKPVIKKVEEEIFPGNTGLAANYVHMAVDEIRDGVAY